MDFLVVALQTLIRIVKEALASDDKWRYLLANITEIVEAAKVIIVAALDLFGEERVSAQPEWEELGAVLADLNDEPPMPTGPLRWIMIAKMVFDLIMYLREREAQSA